MPAKRLFYSKSILVCISLLLFGSGNEAFCQQNLALNRAALHSSAIDYNQTGHLATDGHKNTFWKSNFSKEASLSVDLGAVYKTRKLIIHHADETEIQVQVYVSTDGSLQKPENWKVATERVKTTGMITGLPLRLKARFVKIIFSSETDKYFVVSEIEISGNKSAQKQKIAIDNPATGILSGNGWKIIREGYTAGNGHTISEASFDDSSWIPASIPGTVLANYLAAGAVPDPLYADHQLQISESWFTADFWYRKNFIVPGEFQGRKIFLNFNGINWKAEVYVNGQHAGNINGAFTRAAFDVTDMVTPGKTSGLAVLIRKNDNPGDVTEQHLNDPDGNGGIIGLDSPTYVSAIGWNWLPTIRGRNTGITDNVYLSTTGKIAMKDPFLTTTLNLPDTSRACFRLKINAMNLSNEQLSATIKVACHYFKLDVPVENLKPGEERLIEVTENQYTQLCVKDPALWWPNGYGRQQLDTLTVTCISSGVVTDSLGVPFGIRQYEYKYVNSSLHLFVNGFPLMIRGGNWGLPEALLRCDAAKFDLWVRLHKDMNLNMIRNWVGQTSNDAFYEACNRHGIMIFDDFWLANPVDGPHPANEAMFISNATDKIKRFRNHPSLVLWAGRNEGYPPATLDSAFRSIITEFDNSRHYISNSAQSPVTGLGPYENKEPEWYFQNRGKTFHTEQGIVSVPSKESLRRMMPEKYLWPVNDLWGLHDWTQPRVKFYTDDMTARYGSPENIDDFCRKASMLNMEGPKAMMETWQSNRGPGVLVWMTHPAWPSLICQTYDYFLEPTAAYFALKKGCEPLHILWNPVNDKIEIANNTIYSHRNLKATAQVYDITGKKINEQSVLTDAAPNSTVDCFTTVFPAGSTKIQFIRLSLHDENNHEISNNFYWRSNDPMNYTDLNNMPEVKLQAIAGKTCINKKDCIEISLANNTLNIALMINLKINDTESGERLLPAFWSDNYFSMVAGETRTVTITPENKLSGDYAITIEGWNMAPQILKVRNQN